MIQILARQSAPHRIAYGELSSRVAQLAATVCLLILPDVASAQMSPREQRGLTFVRANCGACHATDKISSSPLNIAPLLRDLHLKYPIESLQESLVEGIITGHPNMPEFQLDPKQTSDAIAYLKMLER